jgi:hypothetical protein
VYRYALCRGRDRALISFRYLIGQLLVQGVDGKLLEALLGPGKSILEELCADGSFWNGDWRYSEQMSWMDR